MHLSMMCQASWPNLYGQMLSPLLASTSLLALIDLRSTDLFGPDIHMPINLGGCAHEYNFLPSFLPMMYLKGILVLSHDSEHDISSNARAIDCCLQHSGHNLATGRYDGLLMPDAILFVQQTSCLEAAQAGTAALGSSLGMEQHFHSCCICTTS